MTSCTEYITRILAEHVVRRLYTNHHLTGLKMDRKIKSPYEKLHRRFDVFRKEMRDIWESYNLIDYYMNIIHSEVKSGKLETFVMPHILEPHHLKKYSKADTYGAVAHMQKKSNSRRILLEAVSEFENYLTYLVWRVYKDFPNKLSSTSPEDQTYQLKLFSVILDSTDKEEMIDKVIEEKIRGIFYGNPLDFFQKDKAHLGFNDYFKNNCRNELHLYAEILARRNIIVHNGGSVDRKYLREVENSSFKLGNIITLSSDYLRESIIIMEGLGTVATQLISERTYNQKASKHILENLKSYKRYIAQKPEKPS